MPIGPNTMRGANNCRSVINTPANNCLSVIFWIQLLAQLKKSADVFHRNMNDGHKVAKFMLYLANVEM